MTSMKVKNVARTSCTILVSICLSLPLLLLTGCKETDAESYRQQNEILLQLPKQEGWKPYSGNPVIQAGDFIDKGSWNDPDVSKEDGKYVMYLTSGSTENPLNPPVLPYRAISADGIHWRLDPQKPLLDASGTPFVSVETPSVVKFKGFYHMFYTGVYPEGEKFMFALGHAVSEDGLHWIKEPQEMLKPTGNATDWNGLIVGEPGAVVYNDSIYVYFSAAGAAPDQTPAVKQSIGFVVTQDGRTFSTPQKVLERSATYPPGGNFCGYSAPSATIYNGEIHLFYDVAIHGDHLSPEWQQVALTHAVSRDGGKSFTEDKNPIFVRTDFDWTGGEIRSPSALFEQDKLHLWFAGMVPPHDFGPMIRRGIKGREFGIGYASINIEQLTDRNHENEARLSDH